MWTYQNPVKIVYGDGSLSELPELLDGRSYVAVTYPDQFARALGEDLAVRAGPALMTIDDVAPNPDFDTLSRQIQRLRGLDEKPQAIVALGGGSVIDSAKVLSAADGDFAKVRRFLETKAGAEDLGAIPIIAVPTTAGTGSEVTCWGTVWDTENGLKYSLSLPGLFPEAAVIDPALMISKPHDLTVSTGLDALSHALESVWNKNANPISLNYAVTAAREILEVLPSLAQNLGNAELRARMALAALFAGMAFSSTKTAIAHSISYPITLRHHVPHGIACSFTLPMVMRSVDAIDGHCSEGLARVFECSIPEGANRLQRFLESLGVSTDPASHGVSGDELQELLVAAFENERGQNFVGSYRDLSRVAFGKVADA